LVDPTRDVNPVNPQGQCIVCHVFPSSEVRSTAVAKPDLDGVKSSAIVPCDGLEIPSSPPTKGVHGTWRSRVLLTATRDPIRYDVKMAGHAAQPVDSEYERHDDPATQSRPPVITKEGARPVPMSCDHDEPPSVVM
jgi:hypothetical protein